jgi:hypothetical protein
MTETNPIFHKLERLQQLHTQRRRSKPDSAEHKSLTEEIGLVSVEYQRLIDQLRQSEKNE